jgi:hypothetical protein
MFRSALLALVASLSILLPAHATSVLPMYLDEIVDTAAVAFQGTVIENRTAKDESGRIVTYTTFQVQEALKGTPGVTYTIKQIGGELPAEGIQYRVHGIPRFGVGQHVVVFLYGVSKAGFSSPVGLEQGRFFVSEDGDGKHVANGRDFRDMTKRMTDGATALVKAQLAADKPVKELRLEDFKQMVRGRVASQSAGSNP